jgi:hypothetical protein
MKIDFRILAENDSDDVLFDGVFIGYITHDVPRRIGLMHCPECHIENWGGTVVTGFCAWCGYDLSKMKDEIVKAYEFKLKGDKKMICEICGERIGDKEPMIELAKADGEGWYSLQRSHKTCYDKSITDQPNRQERAKLKYYENARQEKKLERIKIPLVIHKEGDPRDMDIELWQLVINIADIVNAIVDKIENKEN